MTLPWTDGRIPALLPIYDPSIARWPLSPTLEAFAAAGVEWVQYRHKQATDSEFLVAACEAERLCNMLGMYLLLNDRVAMAAALTGVGAHIGQTDMPVEQARRLLPHECLGLSTDSRADVQASDELLIDYLAVGPVFATESKIDAGAAVGLDYVRSSRQLIDRPLVAIGGINETNACDVIAAGADCVAVLSAVVTVEDPMAAANAICESAARGLVERSIR